MLARAASRDDGGFESLLRKTLEYAMIFSVSMSGVLALESGLWVRLLFGAAYAPAALAVSLLAPTLVLTYFAQILSTALILRGRGWWVTLVNIVTLGFAGVATGLAIRPFQRGLGVEGAAGAGAAVALLTAEAITVAWLVALFGRSLVDGRLLRTGAGLLGGVLAALAAHLALRRLGNLRLFTDSAAYLAVTLAAGAIRPREVLEFVRDAWRVRREAST